MLKWLILTQKMLFETSDFNPLSTILAKDNVELSRDNLIQIGAILKQGGVIAENYHEVIGILQILEEYGIVKIEYSNKKHFLRITNGKDPQ